MACVVIGILVRIVLYPFLEQKDLRLIFQRGTCYRCWQVRTSGGHLPRGEVEAAARRLAQALLGTPAYFTTCGTHPLR